MMTHNHVIGLEKGIVRLAQYTPEWARLFKLERDALWTVVAPYSLDIQHVGSTSIPGMLAKPIIDIGIAVVNFDESRVCIPLIEGLGYEYRGEFGIPRRHYFRKGDPLRKSDLLRDSELRTFHIHMCEIGSTTWKNLILFRDYLCQHPLVAKEYAELKTSLAAQFHNDREAYLNGKTAFVERVLQRASA